MNYLSVAIIRPHKTNAELIVNPHAVLTLAIMHSVVGRAG